MLIKNKSDRILDILRKLVFLTVLFSKQKQFPVKVNFKYGLENSEMNLEVLG